MSTLRPYQTEALDALYTAWRGGARRIGVGLPTGVGKTHIMAHLGRREVESGNPVVFLVHRDTLVDQTTAKLRTILPATTPIGVVKAERNQIGAQAIVCSVHTLRRPDRRAFLRELSKRTPHLKIIVDEAHVSRSATYMSVFDDVGAFSPRGADLAGFTATWIRSDSQGLGDVWEDVVYHRSIQWAMRQRPALLVHPRAIRVGAGADLTKATVSRATGDYRESDMERAVMLTEVRDAMVKGVLRHRNGRPGVLFAPTVESAEFFRHALVDAGVRAAGWYHSTSAGERSRIDRGIRSGELDMMTTCTAVAEGYDNPQLAFGVLARPTQHVGLFIQMVGRLLRPWPGKSDALLLDVVGSTSEVKLRSAIDLATTAETAEGEALDVDEEPLPDGEVISRERMARVVREDTEVSLFAGTPVQWLMSPVGIPFVSCGQKTIVFIVEGPDGWYVGEAANRLGPDNKPQGQWVATGLSQEDALTFASDHAETYGEHLSRRSARWRSSPISEAQTAAAVRMGIDVTGMTRGQVSDHMSIVFSKYVLGPFAAWSAGHRQAAS